jgi:hypothetical protein
MQPGGCSGRPGKRPTSLKVWTWKAAKRGSPASSWWISRISPAPLQLQRQGMQVGLAGDTAGGQMGNPVVRQARQTRGCLHVAFRTVVRKARHTHGPGASNTRAAAPLQQLHCPLLSIRGVRVAYPAQCRGLIIWKAREPLTSNVYVLIYQLWEYYVLGAGASRLGRTSEGDLGMAHAGGLPVDAGVSWCR